MSQAVRATLGNEHALKGDVAPTGSYRGIETASSPEMEPVVRQIEGNGPEVDPKRTGVVDSGHSDELDSSATWGIPRELQLGEGDVVLEVIHAAQEDLFLEVKVVGAQERQRANVDLLAREVPSEVGLRNYCGDELQEGRLVLDGERERFIDVSAFVLACE